MRRWELREPLTTVVVRAFLRFLVSQGGMQIISMRIIVWIHYVERKVFGNLMKDGLERHKAISARTKKDFGPTVGAK